MIKKRRSWKTINVLTVIVVAAGLVGATVVASQPGVQSAQASREAADAGFSYAAYEAVLSEHVDASGRVDYAALAKNPAPLRAFQASLAKLDPKAYEAWDSQEQLAFWINAYNALTLAVVVDHYPSLGESKQPLNSIRQIPGAWTDIRFEVMGRKLTLDQIEHEVLRKQFQEPRIHMAVNCASNSCPVLRSEPYKAGNLEQQLSEQARQFLAQPENLRVDPQTGKVQVSSIFQWFQEDFAKATAEDQPAEHGVLEWIERYAPADQKQHLVSGRRELEYQPYDWSLNEQRPTEE